ncbi:MAG: response regulator [Bdellovibrionaceae bacterium]|nr:response regulator [Pseudobdellovibrionaceae bacterium]
MVPIVFLFISTLFALGLYFIIPIVALALPFVAIPAGIYYFLMSLHQAEREVSEMHTVAEHDALVTDDFLMYTEGLTQYERDHILKLAKIRVRDILARLPSDVAFRIEVSKADGIWNLHVVAHAMVRTFSASASGFSANEALLLLQRQLDFQIQDWHTQRRTPALDQLATMSEPAVPSEEKRRYKILIVDDDIDAATLASRAFRRLGCYTEMATSAADAVNALKKHDADIVILDWDLGDDTFGSDVITKAVNSYMSDHSYGDPRVSKVITYSSTQRQDIWLPQSPHFHHTDHWLKPVGPADLEVRTKHLLQAEMLAS